ncbi:MAG: DUF2207 domain-containing protein [Steroidobacteraceae bacterium]
MNKRLPLILGLLVLLATVTPATADERILRYDSDMAIQTDGSVLVTESIRVRAEGTNIRRGIYRDFPTRYKDGFGNQVEVAFELLGVERDGHSEPNFTERVANGIRVNTGDDTFLPTPGEFTFTIRYRTTRQLGFFAGHDELYWNVTGLGWDFFIDEVHARVLLPSRVASAALNLDGYTGHGGEEHGKDYQASSAEPGVALFHTTRSLAPYEGLTISVGFPKGIIEEPSGTKKVGWFLRDNRGVLVALAGLILLGIYYLRRWTQVGIDPAAGPTFPRYQPPEGFAPGELRMLRRMSNDQRCFSADVVDMGVRGFLQIHQGHGSEGWRLVREPHANVDRLSTSQRVLAKRLFEDGNSIVLKDTEAARVSGALSAHAAEMSKRLKPRYFKSNGGIVVMGGIASLLVGLVSFLVSGGNGIPALIALGVLGLVMHLVFARLLKAPTREGRKLLDEIEGLRMYLGVAERDELKSLPGPGQPPALDAKRYEALLPYAMALEVEEAWTSKFTAAVGAAMAQQSSPGWYHGGSMSSPMGLASIGNSLGGALTQQISASSTPPGSSSGGGGGGSSGGGGGGGGGGGR